MKTKAKIIITITAVLFILSIICLCPVDSVLIKSSIMPEENLPDKEMVFDVGGNDLAFTDDDGNGYETRTITYPLSLFYRDSPFKVNTRVNILFDWSYDGNYLGFFARSFDDRPEIGYPVIVSKDGVFFSCDGEYAAIRTSSEFDIFKEEIVLLTTITGDKNVVLYDLKTCKVVQTYYQESNREADILEAAISMDGKVAISLWQGRTKTHKLKVISSIGSNIFDVELDNSAYDLAWSKDNQWLAFIKQYENDLYIIRADGSDLKKIVAADGSPSWSPDGKWIVFHRDGEIIKVEVETGKEVVIGEGCCPSWRWDIP